ncbi:MAG: hypothetical protein ABI856_19290 [Nitrospira sp.]
MYRVALRRLATVLTTCLVNLSITSVSLAGPPVVDPCSLVTNAEVEQVVGKLKGAPTADKMGNAASCNFEFANGKDAFEIWVGPDDAFMRIRKDAKKPVTVKGLGDDAFMNRGAHGLDYVDLIIKKGVVLIQLAIKETAGDEDKLVTLGKKAVGRF